MQKNSAPNRWLVSSNVLIQIVLAAALVVFANFGIHYWHPKHLDLRHNDYYRLSDKTKQLLKSLHKPVEIIVFFQPQAEAPVTQQVFEYIQQLLKEYDNDAPVEKGTSLLRIRYVDPDRDPVSAEKLYTEYNVKVPNVVVFACDKRSKYVQVSDMVEFSRPSSPFEGGSDRVRAFKGEQQFTSAIQNVLEARQPKIYFLQGHGEGDPDEFAQHKGYSSIGTYIRRDNLVIEKLNLAEKTQVPNDCDVLIVCGPSKSFADIELKAIQDYLAQNGRLMVLLDALKPDTGLEKFLSDYGVRVGNDAVLFRVSDRLGGEALVLNAPCSDYGNHPITQSLKSEGSATLFPTARSIDRIAGNGPAKQMVTVLAQTPPMAWAETDLAKLREDKAELDEKDRKGPVPVAVAVEPASAGEMEREGMRMVVFGSSSFVRNGSMKGGNVDIFMNSINWLLKRQELIGIAPKTPQEFNLALEPSERNAVVLMEVVLIPLAVGIIGFLVWLSRRK